MSSSAADVCRAPMETRLRKPAGLHATRSRVALLLDADESVAPDAAADLSHLSGADRLSGDVPALDAARRAHGGGASPDCRAVWLDDAEFGRVLAFGDIV